MGIVSAVGCLITLLLVLLVLVNSVRRLPKTDPETGAAILRYTWFVRGTALVFGVLSAPFLALGSFVALAAPPQVGPEIQFSTLGGFLLFGPLFWFLLLEVLYRRLLVTEKGIHSRSPWRAARCFGWEEITRVSYSALNSWFILTGAEGRTIVVSVHMTGIRSFVRAIRSQLARENYRQAEVGFTHVDQWAPPEPSPEKLAASVALQLSDLGQFEAEYRSPFHRFVWFVVGASVFGLIGLFALGVACFAQGPPGPRGKDDFLFLIFMFLTSPLLLGMSALFTWQAYRDRTSRLIVCSGGLGHLAAGKITLARWEDVEEIWWDEHIADARHGVIHFLLRLNLRSGRRLRFGSSSWVFPNTVLGYEELNKLRTTVENEMIALRLAVLLTDYGANRPIRFGPVVVSRQGVAIKERLVPWDQVAGVIPKMEPLWRVIGPFRWALLTSRGEQLPLCLNEASNLALLWKLLATITEASEN
jgi:hypothetical protein